MNKARTDEFNAVGFPVMLKVGAHIPVFHPLGYDAKLEIVYHLDTLDGQNVVVIDLLGDQHLLTKPLRVT